MNCINPLCGKEFPARGKGKTAKKYCSIKCGVSDRWQKRYKTHREEKLAYLKRYRQQQKHQEEE